MFFCNYLVFMIYYLLKMASSVLGVDSNIIFDILGTFQMLTKFGALDPLFTAEVFLNIQEMQNRNSDVCDSENLKL